MMLNGETCGTPIGQVAEVVSAAKKPLPAGTVLDGEGGYCVYGLLEKAEVAREEHLLPVGLSQGAIVTRDIPEDGMVTFDDVEIPDSEVLELRRLQDQNQVE
jgi:predicted homoserine dehydrogenase-like protein